MTETEWNLKRQNLALRIELMRAQSQLLQRNHDDAVTELKAMGDSYVPPQPSEPDKPS